MRTGYRGRYTGETEVSRHPVKPGHCASLSCTSYSQRTRESYVKVKSLPFSTSSPSLIPPSVTIMVVPGGTCRTPACKSSSLLSGSKLSPFRKCKLRGTREHSGNTSDSTTCREGIPMVEDGRGKLDSASEGGNSGGLRDRLDKDTWSCE